MYCLGETLIFLLHLAFFNLFNLHNAIVRTILVINCFILFKGVDENFPTCIPKNNYSQSKERYGEGKNLLFKSDYKTSNEREDFLGPYL